MTLELCNWVVHMGNWYKVHKGWVVRHFTAVAFTDI